MNAFMNRMIRGAKIALNHLHGILTTAKSWAALIGSGLTALSAANGMPMWVTTLAVAFTAFSVWELPYDPFLLKEIE